MSIYVQKQKWKILLFVAAILIVIVSLWYTNRLVKKIADDERSKVKLWAEAVQRKAKLVKFTEELFSKIKIEERKKAELYAEATKRLSSDAADFTFVLSVLQNNTTVPVILTNNDKITGKRNLDPLRENDTSYVREQLNLMKKAYPPIEIEYLKGKKNYLYYNDSKVFADIKLVFDSLIKSFISEVALNTNSVPVIYTDSTRRNVILSGNIDSVTQSSPALMEDRILEMSTQNPPILIDLGSAGKNYIFYEESFLLTQLKYYPYFQFGVIGLFLLIAYTLFSTARKSEQNQVWVGMSKETAHQLGTPLSSLMAWMELLKAQGVDDGTLKEINRDLDRLNTITERFSKIGSKPNLQNEDVAQVLEHSVNYIKLRTSKNVQFSVINNHRSVQAKLSVPLFEWVVENICKNAIDAMDGKGSITVEVTDATQFVYIDISDTGKGIPKGKNKTVFEPGFTTKKRGWGLGLSLCKRIIENYHNGKIFVKRSEPGVGTTFRIVLNK
ncbi:MAG: sensor histidine kinase [Bacteroidia bacterium]